MAKIRQTLRHGAGPLLGLMLALGLGATALAHDHPEGQPGAIATAARNGITKDTLAQAIANYMREDAKKTGGLFLFYDPKEHHSLALKFDHVVDMEALCQINSDTYFACTLLNQVGSKNVYDVDVFMKGKTAKDLKVSQVLLHKKDGVPRYNWAEKHGRWYKAYVH